MVKAVVQVNKRQLEVQKIQANDEAKVIRQLKQVYTQASKDCEAKIRELSSRTDMENLQSIIYQKQYQEAVKKQIDGVLNDLNTKSFTTIADYLTGCYETGFFGTLYDLQGQGIPLIFPMNQDEIVRAIQTDAKLSKGLYSSLGEDVDYLKKSIKAELSRGISNGSSWNEIAGHIANGMNSPFKKAYNRGVLIARTEGHRVQQESTLHCQQRAKSKGADVVKQWDSTLDGATRPHHVALDGQIREVEEPFEVDDLKAMHPGGFGKASEDCNCRCCLLQRARWALSDEEFYDKWNGDRNELVKVPAKSYNEFKKKADEVIKQQEKAKVEKLELSDFPKAFTEKSEKKITQKMIDYVNGLEGANPDVIRVYKGIGKLDTVSKQGIPFKISHGKNHAVKTKSYIASGKLADVQLVIPKLTGDNIAGQINTMLHEEMHLIDLFARSGNEWFSTTCKGLRNAFSQKTIDMSDEVRKLFKEHDDEYHKIRDIIKKSYDAKKADLREVYFPNGTSPYSAPYSTYKEYEKALKKLDTQMQEEVDYQARNIMGGGVGNLEDIYDALSGGSLKNSHGVLYGHGASYYAYTDSRIQETLANYGALSVTRPDLIELLKADKPELVTELEAAIQALLEKVGE